MKKKVHLYAVLRYDPSELDRSDPQMIVSLKEVHPTLERAKSEVARLNDLAKKRGVDYYYYWEVARFHTDLFPIEVLTDEFDLNLENWGGC